MSERETFMREVRRGLEYYRTVQDGPEAKAFRDQALQDWADVRDCFELWLYTTKFGDPETSARMFRTVAEFCRTSPRLMAEFASVATERQTERWMAEAEGKR